MSVLGHVHGGEQPHPVAHRDLVLVLRVVGFDELGEFLGALLLGLPFRSVRRGGLRALRLRRRRATNKRCDDKEFEDSVFEFEATSVLQQTGLIHGHYLRAKAVALAVPVFVFFDSGRDRSRSVPGGLITIASRTRSTA